MEPNRTLTAWETEARHRAIELVLTVNWPWTERQKRLWYIGVLAGLISRKKLEKATMLELQDLHREVIH